jgi:DNA replication protein DnaC
MDKTKQLKTLYQKKRDKAFSDLEERKKEIYTYIPKVKSIESQMKKMGLKVAMASLKNPSDAAIELKVIEEEVKVLQREKAILLTEQNIPHDYLEVHFECSNCEDTGFVNGKPCHCYKQEQIKLSYEFYTLTDVLNKENFDTFNLELFSDQYNDTIQSSPRDHMKAIKSDAEAFVKDFKHKNNQNYIFSGQVGLGKTFVCNCIAKALLDKGHTVLYQTAFKIIDIISNYRFNSNKTDQMRQDYRLLVECDLLIIDDLGTEMINSFSNTEMFNIINSRLLASKKTIISTNFTPEQLEQNYSSRIFSRLIGNYKFVAFIGDDLRWEV